MLVKTGARVLLRVETTGMQYIPSSGPVILATNHVNFIDAPLLYTLLPREATGLAKAETWHNPILGLGATSWGAIPIRRGELDLTAFRRALQVLRDGKMLGIAPEGTRSRHGCLLRGRGGIVGLSQRIPEAPIVPAAMYGHERYAQNWRRLHRTKTRLAFGQGFHLKPGLGRMTHEVRQKVVDEIMMQIAALLPPAYRGVYSDLATATEDYLQFPPGAVSNVRRVLGNDAALPTTWENAG